MSARIHSCRAVVVAWMTLCGCARSGLGDHHGDSGDPGPILLPEPPNLQAFVMSSTSVRLTWDSAGGPVTDYRIAYDASPNAPRDCHSGSVIGETGVNENTREHDITGLTPATDHGFRVCSVAGVSVSAGATVVTSTFPTCDYSVGLAALDTLPLDGVATFDELELFMSNAVNLDDSDGAGVVAFCLEAGLTVVNDTSDQIAFPQDNLHLIGAYGAPALLENRRTDAAEAEQSVLRINAAGVGLANLTLGSAGQYSNGLVLSTAEVAYLESLSFANQSPTGSASFFAIDVGRGPTTIARVSNIKARWSAGLAFGPSPGTITVGAVRNVEVITHAENAEGLILDGGDPGSSIAHIAYLTVLNAGFGSGTSIALFVHGSSTIGSLHEASLTTVEGDSGAIVLAEASTIGSITSTRIITNGRRSPALALASGSSIGYMRNVMLIRGAAADGDSTAIVTSQDTYFDSANITDVMMCSEPTTSAPWQAHASGPGWGFLIDESLGPPTAHNPYNGGANLGAQTFPFSPPVGEGQHIQGVVMGGVCP